MRHHNVKRRVVLSAAVAAVSGCGFGGFGAPRVQAATDNWLGTSATTPTWDQAANWDLGAKPGTGDDAVFPTPIPTTAGATIGLGTGETANSLTFNAAYTLGTAAGTGDLTLTSGNVTVATGVTANIVSQLKGTAGLTLNGGGTLAPPTPPPPPPTTPSPAASTSTPAPSPSASRLRWVRLPATTSPSTAGHSATPAPAGRSPSPPPG